MQECSTCFRDISRRYCMERLYARDTVLVSRFPSGRECEQQLHLYSHRGARDEYLRLTTFFQSTTPRTRTSHINHAFSTRTCQTKISTKRQNNIPESLTNAQSVPFSPLLFPAVSTPSHPTPAHTAHPSQPCSPQPPQPNPRSAKRSKTTSQASNSQHMHKMLRTQD